MSAISTIDFCCGRTQHDTCRKCGRDFNAVAPVPPDVLHQLERLPPGIAPHERLEFKAFRAGLVYGLIIGAGLAALASVIAGAIVKFR